MMSSHWTAVLLVFSYLAHSSTSFAPIAPQQKPQPLTAWTSTLTTTTISTTRLLYQTGSQIELELPKDILLPSRHHDTRKDIGRITLPTEQSEYSRPPRPLDFKIVHESKMGSKALPLILKPTSEHQQSKEFLQFFLLNNQRWVSDQIKDYGAVVFRGFDVTTATDVEDTVLSYNPNLSNEYRGTSPRNALDGSQYVFSAAEVPSNWPIAQHIEMSFLPSPPKQLYFSALQAPKTVGGETALADFRKVYQDVPIRLREKLAAKKIRYRRTHPMKVAGGERSIRRTHDVASLQTWPSLFGTSDKREVEKIAKMENPAASVRWEGPDGNIFVSEFVSEPFRVHPETGEMVWFNHANVFHWTTFTAELVHSYRRTKDVRFLLHAIRAGAKSIWNYGILRRKMGLHIEYGDGTPISLWEMYLIRKAIHKNMIFNRWQQGDILFIDNLSTSHGRQPTYDSGRKIAVAWSE